jgi:hypothetical protein
MDVQDSKVKAALEDNTDSSSRWVRAGIGFSAVEAYRRKMFAMPFEVAVSAQRLLNAKNTPSYDRIDVDLKLYF